MGQTVRDFEPDGTVTVYCLNDGDLDRPSVLGTAESYEAAWHLAEKRPTSIGYDGAESEADAWDNN